MITRTQRFVFTLLSSLSMLVFTPTLRGESHTTHHWITGHSADPYTGQTYPYASLVSATTTQTSAAVLTLLCGRYQTVVSVYWGEPLSGEHIQVRYSPSHRQQNTQENWIVSTHSPTLVYPHDGNQLFADLLASPTFTVEAFPENAPSLQATFSTLGADTALKELITICGE